MTTRPAPRTPRRAIGALVAAFVLAGCVGYDYKLNERVVFQGPRLFTGYAIADEHLREPLGIRQTLETRLAGMDKVEFERVLRGIFEEDEWILVTLGGVLGGLIGMIQAGVVVLVT